MGRVAVDFGVGQGAKRSADIQCDLGQASNEGQRQNQRNRRQREAEGRLASSLGRYSPLRGCASLAPCHPPFRLYARPVPIFQQSPKRTCQSNVAMVLIARARITVLNPKESMPWTSTSCRNSRDVICTSETWNVMPMTN